MDCERHNRPRLVLFLLGAVAGQCSYIPDACTAIYYRALNGVSPPVVIRQVAPLNAGEGRKAWLSGTVKVTFAVSLDGKPERIYIAKRVGLGLGEVAIPAGKDGR